MSQPPKPEPERRGPRSREDYARGLPDYHDPTAGIGGAPPAQSALTLRLVLAAFGLVVCVAGGVAALAAGTPVWFAVVLFVLGAVALVDLVVVALRKARGEPG
jgi:Flp pilus assembly protein TadB